MQNHLKNCPKVLVPCHCKSCGQQLKRAELNSHMEECFSEPVLCQYCNRSFPYKNLTGDTGGMKGRPPRPHYNECEYFPENCLLDECQEKIVRKNQEHVNRHINDLETTRKQLRETKEELTKTKEELKTAKRALQGIKSGHNEIGDHLKDLTL